jgi:hypothetical protein
MDQATEKTDIPPEKVRVDDMPHIITYFHRQYAVFSSGPFPNRVEAESAVGQNSLRIDSLSEHLNLDLYPIVSPFVKPNEEVFDPSTMIGHIPEEDLEK